MIKQNKGLMLDGKIICKREKKICDSSLLSWFFCYWVSVLLRIISNDYNYIKDCITDAKDICITKYILLSSALFLLQNNDSMNEKSLKALSALNGFFQK